MRPTLFLTALVFSGCNYSGDWLLPAPIEGVPAVIDLGTIEVATGTDRAQVRSKVIYAEVGPGDGVLPGGATARFIGSGGPMCVWVDPELVYWNQAVGARASGGRNWSWPDNTYDDGDIDVLVGPSLVYDGIPGERMGDFTVRQRDALGNEFIAEYQSCFKDRDSIFGGNVYQHAGRGTPEKCLIPSTEVGVPYTIAATAWTLPLDDYRLGFAMVVYDGDCVSADRDNPVALANVLSGDPFGFFEIADRTQWEECTLTGEAIDPNAEGGAAAAAAGLPARTWLGNEVVSLAGSAEFEEIFCLPSAVDGAGGPGGGGVTFETPLRDYCESEFDAVTESGKNCSWALGPDLDPETDERCYCGDFSDSPAGGAF